MAQKTFIARFLDGLPLVEHQGEAARAVGNEAAWRQAKQLLARLHCLPARSSVKCTGGAVCHLLISEGVCYLGLFGQSYPHNAAFAYLEDIRGLFIEELKAEFGSGAVDLRSHVETIEKPYYFVRFDRQIARMLLQYRDPAGSAVLRRLQSDLSQVANIMRCNIDELLTRGDSLEQVASKASSLSTASRDFASSAQQLWYQALLQKYAIPLLGVLLMALLVLLLPKRFGVIIFTAGLCLAVALLAAHTLKSRGAARRALADRLAFAGQYYAEHLHML